MADLTRREREVAEFVTRGMTNREIAVRLSLSERTIEYHVEQIRNKLGSPSRREIATQLGRIAPLDESSGLSPHLPPGARQPVRYARSGSINVAFQVVGTGAIDLILVPGWVSHLEQMWLQPTYAAYIDKVDAMTRKRHGAEPLRLTGETDRVFLGTRTRCVVHDRALGRRLAVDKTGSASTVVWNPWSAKAAEIADLEPEDWRRMVCVETANAADDAVTLAPGARHVMTATIRVEAAA